MIEQQQKLVLSPYMEIYELVVPKDNLLRQIKELVDFEFVYDELLDKYCLDNGRNVVPPIRMFKYLLLKAIYDLSDVDVVERSKYDMSFKYFLDMAPEETVINPSSLTKFRKLRLKDMNLLDMLISKTVQIALDKKNNKIKIYYRRCHSYEIKIQSKNAPTGTSRTIKKTTTCRLRSG